MEKIKKINLDEVSEKINGYWKPLIIGELNNQSVKLAKIKGEFVFHNHELEDELFFVVKGSLKIKLENDIIELKAGEMVIIPKGINHKPVAEEEVLLMLFEPSSTLNTGNTENEFTLRNLDKLE